MCEAKVYLTQDGQEAEILRDVVSVEQQEDCLLLASLLGERKYVRGRVKSIDFLRHKVYLEGEPTSEPCHTR